MKTPNKSWVKNVRTSIDGHNFPSKLHASVYGMLKILEQSGKYRDIRCEVRLHVCGNLYFKSDFVVFNIAKNCDEAHEAKGHEFPRFKAVVQAWQGVGPMDLIIWKGSYQRPAIVKVIKGK